MLSRWFDVVTPSPGGSHTVTAGAFSLDDDEAHFENRHTASRRAIYDLGDVERSRFMLRTGQCGHVLSPHCSNWAEPWLHEEGVPMTTQRQSFERGALGTLRLLPGAEVRHRLPHRHQPLCFAANPPESCRGPRRFPAPAVMQ